MYNPIQTFEGKVVMSSSRLGMSKKNTKYTPEFETGWYLNSVPPEYVRAALLLCQHSQCLLGNYRTCSHCNECVTREVIRGPTDGERTRFSYAPEPRIIRHKVPLSLCVGRFKQFRILVWYYIFLFQTSCAKNYAKHTFSCWMYAYGWNE